ncbi:hypothetical protein Rcae01_03449 [Novipirellula caenicola]|uniref:Uncharacterized protein n=1 Tax=Novipirellula caenicola TaxID=1536901 RepID=A0ABP9VS59_9BACT
MFRYKEQISCFVVEGDGIGVAALGGDKAARQGFRQPHVGCLPSVTNEFIVW